MILHCFPSVFLREIANPTFSRYVTHTVTEEFSYWARAQKIWSLQEALEWEGTAFFSSACKACTQSESLSSTCTIWWLGLGRVWVSAHVSYNACILKITGIPRSLATLLLKVQKYLNKYKKFSKFSWAKEIRLVKFGFTVALGNI